jgi:hypothetical protein
MILLLIVFMSHFDVMWSLGMNVINFSLSSICCTTFICMNIGCIASELSGEYKEIDKLVTDLIKIQQPSVGNIMKSPEDLRLLFDKICASGSKNPKYTFQKLAEAFNDVEKPSLIVNAGIWLLRSDLRCHERSLSSLYIDNQKARDFISCMAEKEPSICFRGGIAAKMVNILRNERKEIYQYSVYKNIESVDLIEYLVNSTEEGSGKDFSAKKILKLNIFQGDNRWDNMIWKKWWDARRKIDYNEIFLEGVNETRKKIDTGNIKDYLLEFNDFCDGFEIRTGIPLGVTLIFSAGGFEIEFPENRYYQEVNESKTLKNLNEIWQKKLKEVRNKKEMIKFSLEISKKILSSRNDSARQFKAGALRNFSVFIRSKMFNNIQVPYRFEFMEQEKYFMPKEALVDEVIKYWDSNNSNLEWDDLNNEFFLKKY